MIKAAALQPALRRYHDEFFVDTGQHVDEPLAGDLIRELGLCPPDRSLGIHGGSHAHQTGRMLVALETVLRDRKPDIVLVVGDTNSTLAGALAAAKANIPFAHVEAGVRSGDRKMPEELNRTVVDRLARWCFAPTPGAVRNLAREGISRGVELVGDPMYDLAATMVPEVRSCSVLRTIERETVPTLSAGTLRAGGYLYATVHREENRRPDALRAWTSLLGALAAEGRPVILALHPGTARALQEQGWALPAGVPTIDPVGYRANLALQLHAAAVVTDSGGMQREAAWLGTPCLVLRDSTEWDEVAGERHGEAALVGLDADRALGALRRLAPVGESAKWARTRAEGLSLAPTGAAEAIGRALAEAGAAGP